MHNFTKKVFTSSVTVLPISLLGLLSVGVFFVCLYVFLC